MFSISLALLTLYGSSVTIILYLPFLASIISVLALTVIFPRPVAQAARIPLLPMIIPPVGKSGPGIHSIISASSASGLSMRVQTASIVSPRLCGGISVAIPTAIPLEPFTRRFGKRLGRTVGSLRRSSQFDIKSTVFFSISVSISREILLILASV